MDWMAGEQSLIDVLRKSLIHSDLSFRDFVELALYHPQFGYYSGSRSPAGQEGDFITSPLLSPLFPDILGNLVNEFLSRSGDGMSQVVDIGCGEGALIRELARAQARDACEPAGEDASVPLFYALDRSLTRAIPDPRVTYVSSLAEIPPAD